MLSNNLLLGKMISYVGDIYFSSIEKILRPTCSGGDMAVVFGYEMDSFSPQRLRRRFKSRLEIISTLFS